jgi:hypothetical protein
MGCSGFFLSMHAQPANPLFSLMLHLSLVGLAVSQVDSHPVASTSFKQVHAVVPACTSPFGPAYLAFPCLPFPQDYLHDLRQACHFLFGRGP